MVAILRFSEALDGSRGLLFILDRQSAPHALGIGPVVAAHVTLATQITEIFMGHFRP